MQLLLGIYIISVSHSNSSTLTLLIAVFVYVRDWKVGIEFLISNTIKNENIDVMQNPALLAQNIYHYTV